MTNSPWTDEILSGKFSGSGKKPRQDLLSVHA
jgi:hypothetical protein